MARSNRYPTDNELQAAKDVLERAYRGWVNDLAEELIYECFVEDEDEDALRDKISERTDSGLIYTADQWVTLFASRNTQEAWDEVRGMGSADSEDPVGVWAVLTYQQDVNNEIWGTSLVEETIVAGMSLEERINWLIENHGGKEYPLGPDAHAWIIGDVDDVHFGILVVTGDNHDHEFIGRSIEPEGLPVLMDVILANGGDFKAEAVKNFIRGAR